MISAAVYLVVPTIWTFMDNSLLCYYLGGIRREGLLSSMNSYLAILPLLFALIVNYYERTADIFVRLVKRQTIGREAEAPECGYDENKETIDGDVQRQGAPFTISAKMTTISLALIFFVVAALMLQTPAGDRYSWLFEGQSPRPIGFYFIPLFHGVGLFLIFNWAADHFRLAAALSGVSRAGSGWKFNISTLHPDKCMGLGLVSEVATSAALVLLAISFVIFSWQLGAYIALHGDGLSYLSEMFRAFSTRSSDWYANSRQSIGWLVSWGAYLVFAPAVFFAPLSAVRLKMWEQKEGELVKLYEAISSERDYKGIVKYRKHFKIVSRARVWPFNTETLLSFAASFLSPLILTVLGQVLVSHFIR